MSFTESKASGMLVHAHNSNAKKGAGSDEKERVQSMQSYGMIEWESWREYVAPEACLMDHRTGDLYASKVPSCNLDALTSQKANAALNIACAA